MTNHLNRGNWTHRVVKSQRGGDGTWFAYPGRGFASVDAAIENASIFATEQTEAGVVGTRINVIDRHGNSVAEFRVNP